MGQNKMTGLQFFQIDSFTDRPFAGNPAAVVVLDGPVEVPWMQAVALEMNLSETAFCYPSSSAEGEWDLRWFTPIAEVALCGHATLAAAHALTTEYHIVGEITFNTRSGQLTALKNDYGLRLDFPADHLLTVPVVEAMEAAVNCTVEAAATGSTDLLLELGSAADVRRCKPDFRLLASLADRSVIVTAVCTDRDDVDIVSRVFAPKVGILEDPVTGSAHTSLVAWWAARLGPKLRAEQASPRGGELDVELVGDRVYLTGQAVTVARGNLLV